MLEDHFYFHNQVKKVHMNWSDFCQNPKNLIFGSFFRIFGPSWLDRIFFQKSVFLTLWLDWWANSEIFGRERTEGKTKRGKFIEHFCWRNCQIKNSTLLNIQLFFPNSIRSSLLLTLNIFHTLFWCFYC